MAEEENNITKKGKIIEACLGKSDGFSEVIATDIKNQTITLREHTDLNWKSESCQSYEVILSFDTFNKKYPELVKYALEEVEEDETLRREIEKAWRGNDSTNNFEDEKKMVEIEYDGDVLTEEIIKKLKEMEKRVMKEITEPERWLE